MMQCLTDWQVCFLSEPYLTIHQRLKGCYLASACCYNFFPDVYAPNPVTWNTKGCYVIARYLNNMKGHRNINMMRACDCSWLLAANTMITRLHRLPSERAYQGVQMFPSAPATGNEGWGTFRGVWWECSLGMGRRSFYGLSSFAFQFTPSCCITGIRSEMWRPKTLQTIINILWYW